MPVATVSLTTAKENRDTSNTQQIAIMAGEEGVKRMALTDFVPTLSSELLMNRDYVNAIKAHFSGELFADADGTTVRTQVGGK